jgi:hypothetical protein
MEARMSEKKRGVLFSYVKVSNSCFGTLKQKNNNKKPSRKYISLVLEVTKM